MIRLTIGLILMSLFIGSCNDNNTVIDNTEKNHGAEAHDDHHDDEPIVLNNGEKWAVNEEMMVHVRSMENEVNTFEAKNVEDYSVLAKKIETHIDELVSSCTMKGQSHDELHKWLMPFIDSNKAFSESKTEQEFATNLDKIKASLDTFNTYFE